MPIPADGCGDRPVLITHFLLQKLVTSPTHLSGQFHIVHHQKYRSKFACVFVLAHIFFIPARNVPVATYPCNWFGDVVTHISAPDFWCRGHRIESGFSHNDPGALVDHRKIL